MISRRDHEQAAYESARMSANILSDLRGMDCRARELDGAEYLALLWRWFHPDSDGYPPALFERLPSTLETAQEDRALRHRGELLGAVTRGAALDFADPEHIAYPNAGQVESIAHITTPPDTTSLYWLLNLMDAPPPWRLSVHIHARDRAKTRRHYRLRWRRIWASQQRKQREAKLISPGGVRAGARGGGDRRRAASLRLGRLRRLDPAFTARRGRSCRLPRRRA